MAECEGSDCQENRASFYFSPVLTAHLSEEDAEIVVEGRIGVHHVLSVVTRVIYALYYEVPGRRGVPHVDGRRVLGSIVGLGVRSLGNAQEVGNAAGELLVRVERGRSRLGDRGVRS